MSRTAPDRTETAPYYFTYIDQVPSGDILAIMDAQSREALALLQGISEEASIGRYAPDKWSIREVLGHINDTERLFVSRAFWFARGFDSPPPSFDQNIAVSTAEAHDRSWNSLVDEFRTVRAATASFFQSLPVDAWTRRGIASDNPFTVRALAYLAVGHVTHHMSILRDRYLGALPEGL
jgi:hypothetical protein